MGEICPRKDAGQHIFGPANTFLKFVPVLRYNYTQFSRSQQSTQTCRSDYWAGRWGPVSRWCNWWESIQWVPRGWTLSRSWCHYGLGERPRRTLRLFFSAFLLPQIFHKLKIPLYFLLFQFDKKIYFLADKSVHGHKF